MVPVACNLNGEIDVYQNFIMSPLLVGLGVMIAAYGILPPSGINRSLLNTLPPRIQISAKSG
jgi:hypothetical protein